MPNHFPSARRSRQRGVTLLESMVAFFVLAVGSVAVAHLQSHLRLGADVARERSEAVRIGEEAVEELRTFAAVDGPAGTRTYAAIASGSAVVDAASGALRNTYRVERVIDDAAFAGAKAARIAVRWSDRAGTAQAIVVDTFVAALDPAYSGSLALETGAVPAALRGAHDRAPGVPLTARTLGDGRSAWKPRETGTSAWLFEDRTGDIVGVCDEVATSTGTRELSAEALGSCAAGRWLLAAGTVRAAATAPAPIGELLLTSTRVAIDLRDGAYPAAATCIVEARKSVRFTAAGSLHIEDVALEATAAAFGLPSWEETGDRFLAWQCAVPRRADARWSGRIALVASGWTIGAGSSDGRVCRFARGDDAAANDANIAGAGVERDVGAALLGRNFVVVRGSDPCPSTPPTESHQPSITEH